jgi:DNA-binding MarR family transcriptional regulator
MPPVETMPLDRVERMRLHIRERMHALTGQNNFTGIEIASLVRMIANQYEALGEQHNNPGRLSGPRWGLLLRLLAEEEHGNLHTTPTYLSRCQNVSKNTISSLLRGLEDQGLIARQLDEDDRRIFRITLTPRGRALIQDSAPGRIERMNQLVSHLSPEEQSQLGILLAKLYHSIIETSQSMEVE